ncbi:MAG: hypothetical protein M0Q38_04535 [Bacteroidales bacterium]|jgi:hypothetical protein|nr:hypothetical protein [Bacteroidales bacterium]
MKDKIITPYSKDIPLLKKLGLTIFSCSHGEETFIGTVKNDTYCIDVWVTCMPAMFFRFHIKNNENTEFDLSTGSGNFTEYWTIAECFGQGMIDIDEIRVDGDVKFSRVKNV